MTNFLNAIKTFVILTGRFESVLEDASQV